jgi:hypothetical protein
MKFPMRAGRAKLSIRGLMLVTALVAILIGGAINFLRDPAPPRPYRRPRSIKGRMIIKEGVDINWKHGPNAPDRPTSGRHGL